MNPRPSPPRAIEPPLPAPPSPLPVSGSPTSSTPDWLISHERLVPLTAAARARRPSLGRRAIEGLSRLIADVLFAEDYAGRPGLLQGLEPRVKVLCTALLLVATLLTRSLSALAAGSLVLIVLAWLSRIEPATFIKRVWLFVPLFAGITVLPMVLNVFRPATGPRDVLIRLVELPGPLRLGPLGAVREVVVTVSGARQVAGFVLRVADTVSLAILLTLTTRWSELLRAMRVFGVPRMIVQLLEMTQRYIVLLARLVLEMYLGLEARSLRPIRPRQGRQWVTDRMMVLVGKSLTLSEELYLAMTARGYTGEPRARPGRGPGRADAAALACALLVLIGAGWDHVHG